MCTLIEEENVNIVNLSVELEQAVIQHRLKDDESIYVNEDGWMPFWIRVLKHRGFVGLSTHTLFKKSSTELQRLNFCNRINLQYFMLTAYTTDDDKLKVDFVINFRNGLLRETFIRCCRQFSRTFESALTELDPDTEIVLLPGQVESEDEESE